MMPLGANEQPLAQHRLRLLLEVDAYPVPLEVVSDDAGRSAAAERVQYPVRFSCDVAIGIVLCGARGREDDAAQQRLRLLRLPLRSFG